MKTAFQHVTILGAGLLGGSMALALKSLASPPSVRLWARRQETADAARDLGIPGATADLADAVRSADLLILSVPVGAMPDLLEAALQAGLPDTCLITDVGSVKRTPHEQLARVLHSQPQPFIGSHPMAGSERNGLDACSPTLFQNAACLLTNDAAVAPSTAAALEDFWKSLGCRTSWLSAAAHDALVARISHLPHLIAASAARVCLQNPQDARFGGGGLRDTTRVAAGNPPMWAEIVTENRAALIGPLQETIADLREILAILEHGTQERACEWLLTAKQHRDPLNSPS